MWQIPVSNTNIASGVRTLSQKDITYLSKYYYGKSKHLCSNQYKQSWALKPHTKAWHQRDLSVYMTGMMRSSMIKWHFRSCHFILQSKIWDFLYAVQNPKIDLAEADSNKADLRERWLINFDLPFQMENRMEILMAYIM